VCVARPPPQLTAGVKRGFQLHGQRNARNATYTRSGQWHSWNLSRDMACVKLEVCFEPCIASVVYTAYGTVKIVFSWKSIIVCLKLTFSWLSFPHITVFARCVVFGVVEWKCLRLNYWSSLRQPHYRMVGWCSGMVSVCGSSPFSHLSHPTKG